ncbi:c-type cytochrome [Basilea psittacipulmonis]|uniref:Cytochrome C n=1 Tax=Basilea psittacipulmonis DSM 24701 TaxID=1072685 RepID=A0A077DC25_9BURK|nr:c-type cytochrome [Basilea psittacipulmonis]AIL32415.1 cytochrome C [Basilea psittacipulmonis DSM 24701]
MLKKLLVLILGGSIACTSWALQISKMGKDLTPEERAALKAMLPNEAPPKDDEFVHIPPTMDDLEASDLHPKMKEAIRRGHDLFVNTQQLRGKNVFNNMNCSSCHTGEGRKPFAGPVWPAAVTLPNYRGKNGHVNSLEERIVGCFSYSMNGKAPEYGSDDMLALALYHQWLAKGVPMFPDVKIYGRGYPKPNDPEKIPDYARGKVAYEKNCSLCHGLDGAGLVVDGHVQFPALWGNQSFNWGAGAARVFTMAGFIKHNMPLGLDTPLSDQDAWDIAQYVNSQERPQDPRYTGDVKETRALYEKTFHQHTLYGTQLNDTVLGDHDNVGDKNFLKPEALRPRDFSGKK